MSWQPKMKFSCVVGVGAKDFSVSDHIIHPFKGQRYAFFCDGKILNGKQNIFEDYVDRASCCN